MHICVFASSMPVDECYGTAVEELGCVLGKAGHQLVFGGFNEGLMGSIADGFYAADAPILGVIPDSLAGKREVHEGCKWVEEVDSLTHRKKRMEEEADVFVAVPGGIGTLDELFDVVGKIVVGECSKPVILFNVDGYYDELIRVLQRMENDGFLHDRLSAYLTVAQTPQAVLELISAG